MVIEKLNYRKIRTYSLLGLLALGSCSVLKKPETVAEQTDASIVETVVLEDTLSADMSEVSANYYPDNSLPDSIWESDEALLLKDMDNDEYISTVNNTWMNQLYEAGVFSDSAVDASSHKTNVLHVDDSIIKRRLNELNLATPMDLEYNPIVKSYINTYLYKRSSQMERMMGLAEYYYPMFEQILDKYDIPLELKHLAIVESALNPRAKSRVGASGLWQFMYRTGKAYDLNVSSYVDERFDPLKETEAAARYMKNLYKMMGDWNLVLAAYNSGPGNVKKAIRRSGGHRNYWYIRPYLPRETRGYVPAFIAVNYAMHYGKEHNLKAISPKISYYKTDTVNVKGVLTFEQISKELKIPISELEFLNPSYKLKIIPDVADRDYKLVLPIQYVDDFVNREDSIYAVASRLNEESKAKMPKYIEANDVIKYRVKSGDVLGKIANKYGVRVSDIKRWNRIKGNNIRVGQTLTIYPRNYKASVASSSKSKSKSKKSSPTIKKTTIKGGYDTYTVKSGDSLWLIAKKYPGVSAENIQSWNGISNSKGLKPGMKLKIAHQG
ncbi:MAG: LysM peptidoglycan-binding domain-containing protein [Flavobacteriales bacterium]|nr:LysM peptidoglycan-binding domain-containing protein [Flavobacteriales bacterium]